VTRKDRQLGLFEDPRDEPTRAVVDPELVELAKRLPPHVSFGTSSWTFPGWKGLVYEGDTRMAALTKSGLAAYAKHPLFRAVGIDRSYYAPVPEADLAAYASQLPPDFLALSKVWDEVTTYVFPDHPRYGARAGKKNLRFLDPALVNDELLPPYEKSFVAHTGPFLFEMPRVPKLTAAEHADILEAIERLLAALPTTFTYAFELRTPRLLDARYLDVLRAHGAGHVLNVWTGMPDLAKQMVIPGVLTAPFVIARLLLPPGLRYDDAKADFEPFDRIVVPNPTMRQDVARLCAKCAETGKKLVVLVNNKAEGSAPLTIKALAEAVLELEMAR